MDLKEAINRIEFEIEDDLKTKPFTIAGRMDIERIKQAREELDTLNKGIDELIEKLSIELNCYYKNPQELGIKIIQDLKKLKGSE